MNTLIRIAASGRPHRAIIAATLLTWLTIFGSYALLRASRHGVGVQSFTTDDLLATNSITVGASGQTWKPAGTTAPAPAQSIAIGAGSLAANIDGADDMAFGPGALAHTVGTDPLGGANNGVDLVGIGLSALNANTIGEQEIAIGGHSLESTVNNRNQIGLGLNTLQHSLADNNFAAGTNAMIASITGTHDLVIAVAGLLVCTNCVDDIVLGDGGMISAPDGSNDDISIGFDTLQNGGIQNVGIGSFTLRVATGFNNTGTGTTTGINVSSGDSNTFDGAQTGNGITTGRANSVYGANVTGLAAATSNAIILADGDGNASWFRNTAPSVNFGTLETGSGDWWGSVSGIGAHTAVTLTYSNGGFPTRSRCVATANSIAVTVETIVVTARSASAVTFSCYSVAAVPVLTNCDDFTYECQGQK